MPIALGDKGYTEKDWKSQCWREGKILVTTPNMELPKRCIKCNLPIEEPMIVQNYEWHHPKYFLYIFATPFAYIAVRRSVIKKAKITVGLCHEHNIKRKIGNMLGWFGFFSGLFLTILGVYFDSMFLLGFALVYFSAMVIIGLCISRLVYPRKIDEYNCYLTGCGDNFLDSFPSFPNP